MPTVGKCRNMRARASASVSRSIFYIPGVFEKPPPVRKEPSRKRATKRTTSRSSLNVRDELCHREISLPQLISFTPFPYRVAYRVNYKLAWRIYKKRETEREKERESRRRRRKERTKRTSRSRRCLLLSDAGDTKRAYPRIFKSKTREREREEERLNPRNTRCIALAN